MFLHVLCGQQYRSTEGEDREDIYLQVLVYVGTIQTSCYDFWPVNIGKECRQEQRKEMHYIAPEHHVASLPTAKVVTE